MSRPHHRLLLLLILLAAAALRLWQIDSIPPGFHFDESFEGREAWRILTDPGYRPIFLAGNFGVPPLNAYANAFMFGLFRLLGGEAGPTAMRVTAALFGTLGVLAIYALAAEMRRHEPRLPATFPFLAAAALAVMRWHLHFSRMGIEPVLTPLLYTGALWLLLHGWRTGQWLSFAGAAAALAACLYAYQSAWIIPLLALAVSGHMIWVERAQARRRLPALTATGLAATALVLPLIHFFWQHPDLFLLRPTQIAVVSGGESAASSGPLANLAATARMFWPLAAAGDMDPRRNLPGAAALDVWLALPFFIGVGIALRHSRSPRFALPLIGLAGLILPGVFSEYAPHFHRILGASAPTALLIGLGLAELGKRLEEMPKVGRVGWAWIGLLFILLGGVNSVQTYFGRWAKLPDLYHAFDVGLWEAGRWMAAQPATETIFLTPRHHSHPTLTFAAATQGRPQAISFDGRHIFPFSTEATDDQRYLVIEHEDFRTRLLLPSLFPAAARGPEWKDAGGEVYARVYTRPAGAPPARQPQHRFDSFLGDGIHLRGYDVNPPQLRAGGILYLQLYWQSDAIPRQDWTVFTHLLDAAGVLRAGHDSIPGGGSLPTPRWQADWLILDEYQIPLPGDLPPGAYTVEIGLYQPGGARLPAGDTGVRIGAVEIAP